MLLFIFVISLYALYVAGAVYANICDNGWLDELRETKGKYRVIGIVTMVVTIIVNFLLLFFITPFAKGASDYEKL